MCRIHRHFVKHYCFHVLVELHYYGLFSFSYCNSESVSQGPMRQLDRQLSWIKIMSVLHAHEKSR